MFSHCFKLPTPPSQGSNVLPESTEKKGEGGGFGGMDVEAVNWLVHKPLQVSMENSQNAKEQM